MMLQCNGCGAWLPNMFKFCSRCGMPVELGQLTDDISGLVEFVGKTPPPIPNSNLCLCERGHPMKLYVDNSWHQPYACCWDCNVMYR